MYVLVYLAYYIIHTGTLTTETNDVVFTSYLINLVIFLYNEAGNEVATNTYWNRDNLFLGGETALTPRI